MELSNDNKTVNVPEDWGQSILCIDPVPLLGTYSFTASHSTTKNSWACIGVANRAINLNNNLD